MSSPDKAPSYSRFLLRFGLQNAVWFGDYCRFVEVRLIARALAGRPIDSLLDVGCAGTLFPYYVASLLPDARVVGIDSGENLRFIPADVMRTAARADAVGRVRLFAADARRLPFHDARFDAATAISVLEHIRGDGDVVAIREMARAVRSGGVLAFSVPMAARHTEQESTPWCPYFIRQYDRETLMDRLIRSIGPKSISIRYFGEGHIPYSNYYLQLRRAQERWYFKGWAWKPLRYFGWAVLSLTPLAARAFLRVWDPGVPDAAGRVPGGAAVVLEKT